jgi:hypothetical protein
MRSRCPALALFLLAVLVVPTKSTAQSCQDLRDAGDTLRWALPVAALGMTVLKRDMEGAFQYTRQIVLTGAWTATFKAIGDKTRPDARVSRQSFVSGHVSGAMSGASFLYTRYGKAVGIPAYALGMLTMYSRTCSQKHFADDVLGGALVAMMSNWYVTSPHPDSTRIYPSFSSNGLEISWKTVFGGNRHPREPENFKPRYRTVFEFGPLVQDKNLVRTPNVGGTTIDLEALENEFHYTARFIYELYLTDKHELGVWYGPMGLTEFSDPQSVFTVGDTTFDPSDPDAVIFDSNYRWWDLRASYKYVLVNNERWKVRIGASLQYSKTEFEVEQRSDLAFVDMSGIPLDQQVSPIVKEGHGNDEQISPLVHASVAFKINDRWSLETELDGMSSGSEHYWNNGLWVRYRATQLWDLSFGGRRFSAKIDNADFFNELEFFDYTFQIGRSF